MARIGTRDRRSSIGEHRVGMLNGDMYVFSWARNREATNSLTVTREVIGDRCELVMDPAMRVRLPALVDP